MSDDPRDRLLAFVLERETIRLKRAAGEPPPWTEDPILAAYRFCNVRREHDKVTQWIKTEWREPHALDPDLWFAMCVARFVNWPDTLAKIGYPVPWQPVHFLKQMSKIKGKKFTGAYMVRSDKAWAGHDKSEYLVEMQFNPLWQQRKTLRPRPEDTLNSYHVTLGAFYGLGSFMAAQVVADLKYVEPLRSASDWATFAASGPGSRRGLNRVLGRPVKAPWREDEWRLENERLRGWLNDQLRWDEPIHGQDMNNIECEWDKYERVRLGEGRPRARFHASA